MKIKRLRLASCVDAIVAVHDSLHDYKVDSVILEKFKALETKLKAIDTNLVSEEDVARVESATNRLLEELQHIYRNIDDIPENPGVYH